MQTETSDQNPVQRTADEMRDNLSHLLRECRSCNIRWLRVTIMGKDVMVVHHIKGPPTLGDEQLLQSILEQGLARFLITVDVAKFGIPLKFVQLTFFQRAIKA